jgi:hypothetical protein
MNEVTVARFRRRFLTAFAAATVFSTLALAASQTGTASAADEVGAATTAALGKHFSIFRGPPEPLPPDIHASLTRAEELASDPFLHGLKLELAQQVEPHKNFTLWVVPGRRTLMLIEPGSRSGAFSTSSTWTRRAIRKGLIMWNGLPKTNSFLVKGLVADDVIGVQLSERKIVTPKENAFATPVPRKQLWERPKLIRRESGDAMASH